MLRHSFLRVGKIFLCSILFFPPLPFCSVWVSVLFFIACLLSRRRREATRAIKNNKTYRQTEQKVKGGNNKMLQRNIFRQPIENEWRIIFCRLQVLLESYIFLLVGKYSVLGNLSGQKTFSKIVALIV